MALLGLSLGKIETRYAKHERLWPQAAEPQKFGQLSHAVAEAIPDHAPFFRSRCRTLSFRESRCVMTLRLLLETAK